jgi:hypothetical protein
MKNENKKGAGVRGPIKWQILIGMAGKSGTFTYLDKATRKINLQRLFPINGDTIEWTLDSPFKKQAFQISFSDLNPFDNGTPVSYRGNGGVLSPPVNFLETFMGSKLCKYTVSLSNGWVDDPDVVPVPADAGLHPNIPLVTAACEIRWIVTNGAIAGVELVPGTANMTSRIHQPVEWKWASGQQFETEDFTVTFANPVPKDCAASNDSTELDLVLTPGAANTTFTVSTHGFTTATPGTLKVS